MAKYLIKIGEVNKLKKKVNTVVNKPIAKVAKKAKKKTIKQSKPKSIKQKPVVKVIIEKKLLSHAPENHYFVFSNGKKMRNMYQFVDELEHMHEDVFKEHVNENKNDFANWVEHVFEGKSLADELRQIEDRLDTQRAVLKELVRQLTLEKRRK